MNSSASPTLDPGTSYVHRSEILASDLSENEIVLLNVEQGNYYGTDGVGHLVWKALEQPQTLDSLTQLVCDRYADVSESQCRTDLTVFLNDMLASGLIDPVGVGDAVGDGVGDA